MQKKLEVVIINFTFDYNDRYEVPTMVLCNPDKTEISIISNVKELVVTPRFNTVSEVTFTIYNKYNDVVLPYYNQIVKNRLIHLTGFGYFVIVNTEESFEYETPYKTVTAYSAEYKLNDKGINLTFIKSDKLNTVTFSKSYKFYDPIKPDGTLLYELFKTCPAWQIGYVSSDLYNQFRSFSPSNEGLYGFIQNDVSKSYQAIFDFDYENFIVNVYTPTEIVKNTNIVLTFDNIIKNIRINELQDDICTVLRVNGAENLSIARINPLGTNKIYKFDYYMTDSWLGKDVYAIDDMGNIRTSPNGQKILFKDYVLDWQAKVKKEMESVKNPGSYGFLLNSKKRLNRNLLTANAKYKDAETLYNTASTVFSAYLDDAETKTNSGNTTRYNYYKKIKRACEKNMDVYQNGGRLYNIYSDLADESQNAYFDTESEDIGEPNGEVIDNIPFSLDSVIQYKLYSIKSVTKLLGVKNDEGIYPDGSVNNEIQTIINKYSFEKYFSQKEIKILDPYIIETEYQDNTFIVTDEMNVADYSDTKKNVLTTEGVMTIEQLLASKTAVLIDADYIAQELLKQGYKTLDRVSQPSFSFDVDCLNFLFDKKYEYFLSELKFGSILNIELKDGEWIYPFLQEMSINYEDPTNFSIKFGNRFRLSNSEWTFADLHNENTKTTQTVGSVLPVAAEPIVNGTVNAVESYINNSLIAANQSIKSTKDNEFVIGGYGLLGRKVKTKNSDGSIVYDNEQVWFNNNQISFTDDNWNSTKTVLGKAEINGHSSYGIIGEHIIGKLIAGEQLLIANDENTFVVDGHGATLKNATLSVEQTNGSSIRLNPSIGLNITDTKGNTTFEADTSGNVKLKGSISLEGGTVGGLVVDSSSIKSTNGMINLDSNGTGKLGGMEWNASGDVTINNLTANNGFFKGQVSAQNISYGGENGFFNGAGLADESVSVTKLKVLELNAKYATVENLNATNGVVASKANISDLNATNANINSVKTGNLILSGKPVTWSQVEIPISVEKNKTKVVTDIDKQGKPIFGDIDYVIRIGTAPYIIAKG